jgi:hypothetical protein
MATGKRLWETLEPTVGPSAERTNYGTAFAVKNGQYFYLMSETGELISAKLSPQKYVEVSRAKLMVPTGEAFGRKVLWSHPAFANKCIFVRNDEELACYSLSKE